MTVAGVIVHGDKQWRHVESYLERMLETYAGENRRRDFYFHAYELLSGTKRFDKSVWPLDIRLQIHELVAIPRIFDLPVFHCSIDRISASDYIGEKCGTVAFERTVHAYAQFFCSLQIEMYLKAAAPDEVALLIAEDREQVRKMLKHAHNMSRGKGAHVSFISELIKDPEHRYIANHFPFSHVIESVQFAQKTESSLLQVADACAFAIKRWVTKKPHAERLFGPLREKLIPGDLPFGLGPSVQSVSLAVQPS
jgi:Protein of unknown function (DUF3800)